jgi:hypothetical protein
MSEELLKIWNKHLTALKLKSPYGDALALKYWNEFIRRGGKVDNLPENSEIKLPDTLI